MIRTKLAALVVAGLASVTYADPVVSPECPEEVRGVAVEKSNVTGGLAFTFTTPRKAQIAQLRALMREAATIIEHHTKLAALHPEVMPTSTGEGDVPAIDISVRNVENGAYVVVRPEDPDQLKRLRDGAKDFETFWSAHECVAVPSSAKAKSKQWLRRSVPTVDVRAMGPARTP